MQQNESIQSSVFLLNALYFPFFVNKMIYGAVLFMTGKTFLVLPQFDTLMYILIGLSILFAVGSFYVVPFILKPHIEKMKLESLGSSNIDDLKAKAYHVYLTPFVIRLAMTDAIAICGFVRAFMGTDGLVYLPFAFVSLVLSIIQRPNVHRDVLEKIQGNSVPPVLS